MLKDDVSVLFFAYIIFYDFPSPGYKRENNVRTNNQNSYISFYTKYTHEVSIKDQLKNIPKLRKT